MEIIDTNRYNIVTYLVLNDDSYVIIKDKETNKYNMFDENMYGIIYDVWFDNILDFIYIDDKTGDEYVKGIINNKIYRLYYKNIEFIFDSEI